MTKQTRIEWISFGLVLLLACGLFWLGAWLTAPKDTVEWIDLGFESIQFSLSLWLVLVYTGILPVGKSGTPRLSVGWSIFGGIWMGNAVRSFVRGMEISGGILWVLMGASVLFVVLIGAYTLYARKKQTAAEKEKTE